jgi:hypothetical protein
MEFPSENQPEGVIAIFPSAESLAAVAPEAAGSGESDIAPAGRNVDCNNGGGTDSLRGPGIFAFRIRWLARGNVLVGVQYDASLGPDHDRFVGEARTKLQSLPVT